MQILDIYRPCFTFLPLRGDVKEAAALTRLSDEKALQSTKKTNNSKIFLPS